MNQDLKHFYEVLGKNYVEEKFVHTSAWGLARFRFVTKNLVKKYVNGGVWADVGCGGGVYLPELLKSADKVIAIDISYPVIMRAMLRAHDCYFLVADACALPLGKGVLDGVFSSEVIEHLPGYEGFLSDVAYSIKKGGKIIITCPNWHKKRPFREEPGVLRLFGIEDSYIHTAYKPEELAGIVEKFGFRVIERGSFEKELRLWGKVWDFLWGIIVNFTASVGMRKFTIFLYRLQCLLGGLIWRIVNFSGLAYVMRKLFRRGPRTYIVAEKV